MEQPNVDIEFIPLPFLLFASGRLRTANAGARILLGLREDNLGRYAYEDIFPTTWPASSEQADPSPSSPKAASDGSRRKTAWRASEEPHSPYDGGDTSSSSLKVEGHLQSLVAKVQSSQEPLQLRTAVYTNQTDGSIRSILIVDVNPISVPAAPLLPSDQSNGHAASSSLGSIPSLIKRHSGDTRKQYSIKNSASILPHTSDPIVEDRPRTEVPPPLLSRQTTVLASRRGRAAIVSTTAPLSQSDSQEEVTEEGSPIHPISRTPRGGLASRQRSSAWLRTQPREAPIHAKVSPIVPKIDPQMPSLHSSSSSNSNSKSEKSSGTGGSARSRHKPGSIQMPVEAIDYSLAHSALAAHPRTGVIISRSDLSSGFINSRTRELLMGLKSPEGETTSNPFDDMWFAPMAGREKAVPEDMENMPSGSPLWEDDIVFEDGKVRIDLPDRGFNMNTSVSDVLRWSLKRRKLRQHHRVIRDDISVSSGVSASPPPSVSGKPASVGSASASMYSYRGGMTAGEARAYIESLESDRPWLAHKPYRVYDSAFSQRMEDPFEALFDQCVRKDEAPSCGTDSITVGIETEVGPADTCAFPENECFTYMAESTDPSKEGLVPVRVRRRIVQARAAPLKDMNGDHVGGVVWLRDVTGEVGSVPTTPHAGASHSQAQSPLLNVPSVASQTSAFLGLPIGNTSGGSDPFWQQIINSMPQMVWVTKPDGQHIYFNNKWYSFTGLQPEQSLGVNWQNPFHPDDMPASRRHWSRSLATGEPYSVEYRCRRHDGVWRWQLGRAQALFDTNGKIVAWFGTCTDVEEFVQMRTQLAETSQNLRRVIDLASVTLCCVGKDLKVLFLEGGGALMHAGYEDYKTHDVYLNDVIDSPVLTRRAEDVLNGLESARVELQNQKGIWTSCHMTPIRNAPGEDVSGVVIVCTDITDLKATEAALKQSYEEQSRLAASETAAKEASRLKSEFTANLSHEIRTPITGMIGMSELLLEEPMPPSQHESVRKILRSGEILLKMVGDVLDIGKVEAGKLELDMQPFILSELVNDATAMFRMAASKKGLDFRAEHSDLYEGEIMGDLPRLRQVLLNLLANSVKFTKHGFITLRCTQDRESLTSIRVKFAVEDSGIGIAKDVIPTLFQAFQQADSTTSRQHGGTGLGLAISKNLVKLMGGTIALDSELGQGTRITVEIPFQKLLHGSSNLLRRPSKSSRHNSEASLAAAATSPAAFEPLHQEDTVNLLALPSAVTGANTTLSATGQMAAAGVNSNVKAMEGDLVHSDSTNVSIQTTAPTPPLESGSVGSPVNRNSLPAPRNAYWILLAEDNPLNSEIFVKGITRMGFNVTAVQTGREAVEAMAIRPWDLVLMDGQMPVCDGYEATRLIRKSDHAMTRATTIIALTASAIAGDKERCLEAGMNGYLAKPVRLKALEQTLIRFLNDKMPRAA